MRKHTVPNIGAPMPIAKYLVRAYPALSQSMLKRALAQRDVRINGTRAAANAFVQPGDELAVYISDAYLVSPLEIVYSDSDMAIIAKPQGISVDRDASGIGEDTILARARAAFPEAYLVNRLDHNTGGLMPIALNLSTKSELEAAFANHSIRKFYECLTDGAPPATTATLHHYGQKSPITATLRVYDSPRTNAQDLRLTYTVLHRAPISHLQIELLTGRTHQIRAQLAHIHHPILGDDKYGAHNLNNSLNIHKQQLWCTKLVIPGRGGWERRCSFFF